MNSSIRRWHAYIGLFIAPSVLFFALTGMVQIFGWHEAHGSYRPALLLEKLSAVHKDQVFEQPRDHDHDDEHAASAGSPDAAPQADDDQVRASTLALKWFFFAVSIGLVLSTAIGLWMGVTQIRRTKLAVALILAGALIPLVLVAI